MSSRCHKAARAIRPDLSCAACTIKIAGQAFSELTEHGQKDVGKTPYSNSMMVAILLRVSAVAV